MAWCIILSRMTLKGWQRSCAGCPISRRRLRVLFRVAAGGSDRSELLCMSPRGLPAEACDWGHADVSRGGGRGGWGVRRWVGSCGNLRRRKFPGSPSGLGAGRGGGAGEAGRRAGRSDRCRICNLHATHPSRPWSARFPRAYCPKSRPRSGSQTPPRRQPRRCWTFRLEGLPLSSSPTGAGFQGKGTYLRDLAGRFVDCQTGCGSSASLRSCTFRGTGSFGGSMGGGGFKVLARMRWRCMLTSRPGGQCWSPKGRWRFGSGSRRSSSAWRGWTPCLRRLRGT